MHTGASKNSPFFNFNYKDGGFGLIRTAGIDFGVRLTLRPEGDFAIHRQIGLAGIIEVDSGIADVLFTEEIPDYILAIGIGFSWTM